MIFSIELFHEPDLHSIFHLPQLLPPTPFSPSYEYVCFMYNLASISRCDLIASYYDIIAQSMQFSLVEGEITINVSVASFVSWGQN